MPNLNEVLKQVAMEAVEASNPTGILFGTVETVNPLSVRIDQKTLLTAEFLFLTSNVRPHMVSMTVTIIPDIQMVERERTLLPVTGILIPALRNIQ